MSAGGGRYELGVDVGGTFTDLVLRDTASGQLFVGKSLTTPSDPAEGAVEGTRRLLEASGVSASAIGRVVHGTTLVTNTLIERSGARTAYVTTAGFADVFEVGRQKRYDMYDLGIRFPEPLVPRALRFEVHERVDAAGRVRQSLDTDEVRALAARLRAAAVEAVAVCFLHSYRRPDHERLVAQVLSGAAPELVVCLSAEVAPEIREYPRATTTAANAYVTRTTQGYLGRLQAGLRALGCPAVLHVMLSHGGLATAAGASRFPIRLLESGPAGGALAAAFHAARIDASPVNADEAGITDGAAVTNGASRPPRPSSLAFDMGGTTAKVCLLEHRAPRITSRFEAARVHRLKRGSGLPIAVPCVDLIEIGAGGGSIARVDTLGLLRVGPESAGADPGPACYGRPASRPHPSAGPVPGEAENSGDAQPTVTDADLLLGYLDPVSFLGGAMPLDRAAARAALARAVAGPLGVNVLDAAWAIHATVNAQMADAVRVHAAERGADLRSLDVIAFGGAGPVHAERLARALHLRRVVVPYGAGAASSLGFLVAPLSFDFATSALQSLDSFDAAAVAAVYAGLRASSLAVLAEAGVPAEAATFDYSGDMRYAGQGYEISVSFGAAEPWRLGAADLRRGFEETYQSLYGRVHSGAPVEAVTWRLVARGPQPAVTLRYATADGAARNGGLPSGGEKGVSGTSSVSRVGRVGQPAANGRSHDHLAPGAGRGIRLAYAPEYAGLVPFDVYDRRLLRPGDRLQGPAVVEERESTAVLGPGSTAVVDGQLNLIITPPPPPEAQRVPEAGRPHAQRERQEQPA